MNAIGVEIDLELGEHALQVHNVLEEHVVEVFASEGSDHPFNKWVGHRDVRNRLDLIACSLSTISRGVPAGATSPYHELARKDRKSVV